MTEKEVIASQLIVLLSDTIREEIMKADNEADMSLVNECQQMLSELMSDKYDITEEQINERIAKIKNLHPTKLIHTTRNRRTFCRTAAIICAILISLSVCITAVSIISPEIREGLRAVMKLNEGDSISKEGFTFVNCGEAKYYNTIGELFEEQPLDIMFFDELPEGIEIKEILAGGEYYLPIEVYFYDSEILFQIYYNPGISFEKAAEENEVIESGDRVYVWHSGNKILSMFYDECIYQISYADRETAVLIMDSIKE